MNWYAIKDKNSTNLGTSISETVNIDPNFSSSGTDEEEEQLKDQVAKILLEI